jgi:glucose-6-phosphate isomerase
LLTALASGQIASRIWRRDPAVFVGPSAGAPILEAIAHRLGWLDAPGMGAAHTEELATFARDIRNDGLTNVILLGMGGSSLCAEVLRDVPADRTNPCTITVLDTTDERAIRAVTEGLQPEQALFLVASKSGSTLEVTSLERHFWRVMVDGVGPGDAGRHFVAITDPGTSLESHAIAHKYRQVFVNPADIGGRYSALSFFGLVPAALAGLDVSALGRSAERMAVACHGDTPDNPGLALGAFMAEHAGERRDKLTVLLPDELAPLGAWIEQLVAESTGKEGRGILPVVGEPLGRPSEYGPDRAFVVVTTDASSAVNTLARELEKTGRPVFRIATIANELGGEFLRWEFATAVAGAALALNPFDEPNVREAKVRTQAQLDARAATGAFKLDPPFERGEGYSRREHRPGEPNAHTRRRYVALLDYLPADPHRMALVDRLRAAIRRRLGLATTHGIGPRYLHSTGQYHKGGPNSGIFVLLTSADASATPVPETGYTFSTLKQAQALGDFDALVANGREVVHYHLDDPTADFSTTLERLLAQFDQR